MTVDLNLNRCPGTLDVGYESYSTKCLKQVFNGRKVSHILPYPSPSSNTITDDAYTENRKRISLSGVQEKFSVIQHKNKLRLTEEGERGTHILKPIPNAAKNKDFMPANEQLTMQIASQVYEINTAGNAIIFFENQVPAYITKRFDIDQQGGKKAKEDFASLAGRTAQTHGKDYKYLGNYSELFDLLKQYVPLYAIEAPKLLKLIGFNYLFSNGDAHFKNFALLETQRGDFRLSPAYDLLNSRLHIADSDYALLDGLLPRKYDQGSQKEQFQKLGALADIRKDIVDDVIDKLLNNEEQVANLIEASFLSQKLKRNYLQAYHARLKRLRK